jgi:predicted DCC family thiol-disulfide oxidoreductase YuxK
MSLEDPIIFFDGVCNLCNTSVQFVIKHDAGKVFRFAPLQGETAKRMLATQRVQGLIPDSIILLEEGKIYARSDAALQIASRLKMPWRWLVVLKWVPRPLRDWIYNQIAQHRYRWFGQKETCWLPTPQLKALFLD